MSEFTDTAATLARVTGVHSWTIKNYCKRGLLEYVMDSSGRYLLRIGQEQKVKDILAANRAKQAESLPRKSPTYVCGTCQKPIKTGCYCSDACARADDAVVAS